MNSLTNVKVSIICKSIAEIGMPPQLGATLQSWAVLDEIPSVCMGFCAHCIMILFAEFTSSWARLQPAWVGKV